MSVLLLSILKMAEDQLAMLVGIVQAQNALQQQLFEQSRPNTNDSVASLPTYSGKKDEDVLYFVETVNREATTGNCPEEKKMRLAKGALRETASEWRWLHDAEIPQDWVGWSTALCLAFQKRYTFGEWEDMVTRQVQLKDESGPQYVLTKA